MKTAFCYHRYSSEMQREKYTLGFQRSITKGLAKKHACKILQVYEDEGISGASIEKRPQMLKLLDDIQDLKPDYIICVDQDRIARGNDFWYIKNLMAKSGTSFITEKEGLIDFDDIAKDALSDMMGVFAKLERRMIGQRIKRGLAQKAKSGKFVGCTSNIFGYDYIDNTLQINQAEAKLVKKIFDMYLSGTGKMGICLALNNQGYRGKKGSLFYPKTLKDILTNPLYCGYIRFKGNLYKSEYPIIIDEKTFKAANARIRQRYEYTGKKLKYLLSGMVRCKKCGVTMTPAKQDSGYTYRCRTLCKDVCSGSGSVLIKRLERYVLENTKDRITNLKLNTKIDPQVEIFDNELNIENEKRLLQNKIDRLITEYVDGFIPKDTYRNMMKRLKSELEELEQKQESDNKLDDEHIRKLKALDLFEKMTLEDKRKIVVLLVDKIYILPIRTRKLEEKVEIIWNKVV